MILPPLYGANTKPQDNSWESLLLTYASVDFLCYNRPKEGINNTFNSMDVMIYDARDREEVRVTYGVLDVMLYANNEGYL